MLAHHCRFVTWFGLLLLASMGCKSGMVPEQGDYSMNESQRTGSSMLLALDPMSAQAFEQARELERNGQMTAALKRYVQIAEANPNQPAVWQRMAVAYDKVGYRQYATTCFERAFELDPMNAELWCDCGYGQFLAGDFVLAEESFRRALVINPNLERAHNNLGLAMAKLGDTSAAVEQFKLAGCNANQVAANLKLAAEVIIVAHPEPFPVVMQAPTQRPASPRSAVMPPINSQSAGGLPIDLQPLESPVVMQSNSEPKANAEAVSRLNDYATDPSLAKSFAETPIATSPMKSVEGDNAPKAFATSIEKSFRSSNEDSGGGVYKLISDFEDETNDGSQPPARTKSEVVLRIGDQD